MLVRSETLARGISFELLEVYVRIASAASISAAARQLNLSSSQTTRKLAQLENVLGTHLIRRTTRAMSLTDAGRSVLDWARDVVDSKARMVELLTASSQAPTGTIRCAASHYVAADLLPEFLERFSRRYPDIRISITTTDSMVRLVQDGFDVAVHAGRLPDSGIVGVKVRDFRRVLCASPAYLSRHGQPSHPRDLQKHRCLVHAELESRSWMFRKGEQLISQPIVPFMQADNQLVLLQLAVAGIGVVRLSELSIHEEVRKGLLTRIMTDYHCVSSSGSLPSLRVLYPSRRLPKRTRVFVNELVSHLRERSADTAR